MSSVKRPRFQHARIPQGDEYQYIGSGNKEAIAFNDGGSNPNKIIIELWRGKNASDCTLQGSVEFTLDALESKIVYYKKSKNNIKLLNIIAKELEYFSDFVFYRLSQYEFSKSYCIQTILTALNTAISNTVKA